MKKITIIAVGKSKKSPFLPLIELYTKRITNKIEIKEVESQVKTDPVLQNSDENKLILNKISDDSFVIALDGSGKMLSSEDFAEKISETFDRGVQNIFIIIGGSMGLSQDIKNKADLIISMGMQTWPHMLARVMILEQIYRAEQILSGRPYHK